LGKANKKEGIIYLKAYPLKSYDEISKIKEDLSQGSIVILRFTPLAQKSIEELAKTVDELYKFVIALGGDIARLGEDRIVITPPGVKIFRG
jgi:hypothetical protein